MAELLVDLAGVRENTAAVVRLLSPHGVRLVGVTKSCLGDPRVAAAMRGGGAAALADTRDANLKRLREAHPDVELHRIYLPSLAVDFELGDVTYVSSLEGARAVAARPFSGGGRKVIVMLETGDYREGVCGEGLESLVGAVRGDLRLHFEGIATNYACFQGGPEGIRSSLATLAAAAVSLRDRWEVPVVSGGNSSALALLRGGGRLPPEITELRCGEALLLGQDALVYQPLPGCRGDACVLRAEVLEAYTKPASGDMGRRLVVGIGRQDLGVGAVRFARRGLFDLGRSSDYLVVGVEPGGPDLGPGDVIEMVPSYTALAAAWMSPFVEVFCA